MRSPFCLRTACSPDTTIQSLPIPIHHSPQAIDRPRFATNRDLYFFRIVKERYSRSTRRAECSALKPHASALNVGLWSENGGGERDRTDDLLLAKQALSQLSYTPD